MYDFTFGAVPFHGARDKSSFFLLLYFSYFFVSLSFSLVLLLLLLDKFINSQLRSMGSASVTEDDDEEEDEDASLSCFFVADLSATNALT